MRNDFVGGGAATLSLMLIAYVVLRSATLPVPDVVANVTLLVAGLGALLVVLGIVAKPPVRPKVPVRYRESRR